MKNIIIFSISTFLLTITSFAQEEHLLENQEHEFKHFRISFALGHGYIPQADKSGDSFLIIPSFGLDLQYWFNKKWGISLKNDQEIANYIVQDEADKTKSIERENPIIVSLPLLFSPWKNGLTFMAGPGVEFEENENFSIFRLGIEYEFEMANHWDFSPEFVYDFKNANINSYTFAFSVGKKF